MRWSVPSALVLPEKQAGLGPDDTRTTLLHAKILREKVFLRRLYGEYYASFREGLDNPEAATIVELGSGGGFIKVVIPNAVTSDVLPLPDIDQCFGAEQMPFEDASVDRFCMINTMHHIPDIEAMFRECVRCLKPGGSVMAIEPANTLLSRFIFKHFHHEPFDTAADWTLPSGTPLSASNQALPWIVFARDRARYEAAFPELKLETVRLHTPLRYLVSGGFTARQMLPGWMYPAMRCIDEMLLRPLHGLLAFSMTITLTRQAD
jgi:SAM-dependent methyltransferase